MVVLMVWQNLEIQDCSIADDRLLAAYHLWSSHIICIRRGCLFALQLAERGIYNNLLERMMMEERSCKTEVK